ncbi:MAG: hypothetical protein CML01_00495 [Pseudomonas sp.]|nr:hypothetical protein [Pseudomonas sp.]|tara:strand:+ start:2651 stop:2878 length:228 start_codon:yes stop_codon:yes gene_type:complete
MSQVLADDNEYLLKMWAALTSPYADPLALILGGIQKDGYPQGYFDWKDFVADVMEAMELQDAGQFPDSWYDEDDQ